MDLGYNRVVPDESRHTRFVQRSARRQELLTSHDVECESDHFAPDEEDTHEDSTTHVVDASCQTDKDLAELTVLQRKEFGDLKKENASLKAELINLTLKREGEYLTEDFFKEEKNWDVLKLYTGIYYSNFLIYLYRFS